jgi:hypothetical protein
MLATGIALDPALDDVGDVVEGELGFREILRVCRWAGSYEQKWLEMTVDVGVSERATSIDPAIKYGQQKFRRRI